MGGEAGVHDKSQKVGYMIRRKKNTQVVGGSKKRRGMRESRTNLFPFMPK